MQAVYGAASRRARHDRSPDRDRLNILLVNAAKHTPEESVIWIGVEAEVGGIQIIVEDDGPGVPDDVRTAIFEPFRQGPGDHPSPGAGIGLSLLARVRGAARRAGVGPVWVQ